MIYKARNNNDVIRDNVILWIAQVVNKDDTYTHKVDLTSPDLIVLVEIIKVIVYIVMHAFKQFSFLIELMLYERCQGLSQAEKIQHSRTYGS